MPSKQDPSTGEPDHTPLDELAQLVQGALLRYTFDAQGQAQLVYISEGCRALWGLSPDALLQDESPMWLMAVHEDRVAVRQSFREALRTQQPWAYEWRIADAQGAIKWLRGSGKPQGRSGEHQGWTVFVSDVTDSVRVRALEGTGQRYLRAVFDNIPGLAVQAFGPDRRIDYWNRGSEALYGHRASEVMGQDIIDLLCLPQDQDRHKTVLAQMLADGTQHLGSMLWQRRRDGSLIEVSTNVIQIVHPEHGPHFISIDFDLSERRRIEDQRLALEAQLRESQKFEALGTLAGGVAHDFNNILAAILGNARLAHEDARGQADIEESLNEILKAGARAKALVERILAFSRRQTLERRVMALSSVVDESVRLLRATVPKGVDLEVHTDPATPDVLGDPTQLQQVLLNLCTNAWQAMPERSSGRLGIELRPHAGPPPATDAHTIQAPSDSDGAWPPLNVRLRVRDNGTGMDAATLARLFEPFFTTKPAGEGTGLGLAVVHGILRDHQAVVQVHSQPGQGTVFDLFFKAADPQAAEQYSQAIDAPPPARAPRSGAAVAVLYVDDDAMIAALMRRMLERAGFVAHVFTQPLEALRAVSAGEVHYDLAITDFSMPGMSGLELARALRERHPERTVAITTGHLSGELRQQAPEAGVSALIHKPTTGDALMAEIERLVAQTQAQRASGITR